MYRFCLCCLWEEPSCTKLLRWCWGMRCRENCAFNLLRKSPKRERWCSNPRISSKWFKVRYNNETSAFCFLLTFYFIVKRCPAEAPFRKDYYVRNFNWCWKFVHPYGRWKRWLWKAPRGRCIKKKLHLKTIKRHSPKIQSRGKKKSQDDSSSFYGSHSSDDNAANAWIFIFNFVMLLEKCQ